MSDSSRNQGARPRESRAMREERKRRQEQRRNLLILAAGVLLAAIVGAVLIARTAQGRQPSTSQRKPAVKAALPIDGIPCEAERVRYHEHAHLTIFDAGKSVSVSQSIGHGHGGCFYWLHTHDTTGIIHIEAPHRIVPTLGTFFDIWGQPLSRRHVAGKTTAQGRSMRVYVDQKPYPGNPRTIKLHPHTRIVIELGPPFVKPKRYRFESGY